MAEGEHFTNFRCLVFGTGFALMGAAFGAQVGGWTHWITIGIGNGVGIVLMLVATVLITKSFFTDQPDVNSETRKYAPPPRLQIISANYGVEGGPDPDVAEKYLRVAQRFSPYAIATSRF